MRLIDRRTDDGSRHFASLPKTEDLGVLRDRLAQCPDVRIIESAHEEIARPWIDFFYQGHRFSIRQRGEEAWFFVNNPQCSDIMLYKIVAYCREKMAAGPQAQGAFPADC